MTRGKSIELFPLRGVRKTITLIRFGCSQETLLGINIVWILLHKIRISIERKRPTFALRRTAPGQQRNLPSNLMFTVIMNQPATGS